MTTKEAINQLQGLKEHAQNKGCKFCENVEFLKAEHRKTNREQKKNGKPKILHEISVSIVERTWRSDTSKRRAGRLTLYGYKINYCPECGQKVSRRKESPKNDL